MPSPLSCNQYVELFDSASFYDRACYAEQNFFYIPKRTPLKYLFSIGEIRFYKNMIEKRSLFMVA